MIRLEFRRDLVRALDDILSCQPGRVFVLTHFHDEGCPVLDGRPDCTCREVELAVAEAV